MAVAECPMYMRSLTHRASIEWHRPSPTVFCCQSPIQRVSAACRRRRRGFHFAFSQSLPPPHRHVSRHLCRLPVRQCTVLLPPLARWGEVPTPVRSETLEPMLLKRMTKPWRQDIFRSRGRAPRHVSHRLRSRVRGPPNTHIQGVRYTYNWPRCKVAVEGKEGEYRSC